MNIGLPTYLLLSQQVGRFSNPPLAPSVVFTFLVSGPEITTLNTTDDIPYVLPIPSTYQIFENLLSSQPFNRQQILIKRWRACNHISLGEANKEKMNVCFFFFLILHPFSRPLASVRSVSEPFLAALDKPVLEKVSQHSGLRATLLGLSVSCT